MMKSIVHLPRSLTLTLIGGLMKRSIIAAISNFEKSGDPYEDGEGAGGVPNGMPKGTSTSKSKGTNKTKGQSQGSKVKAEHGRKRKWGTDGQAI